MSKKKNILYVLLGFVLLLVFGYFVFTAKQLGV